MPELPEVETIVRGLRPKVLRKKIIDAQVFDPRTLVGLSAATFRQKLLEQKLGLLRRRAKYIIIQVKASRFLVVHLGMTGGLIFRNYPDQSLKHVKWWLRFADGSLLYYVDARLFGETKIINQAQLARLETRLGPEPLSPEINALRFWQMLRKRKGNLKALLLNQKFIAGVGNIYASEALFLSGISPWRRATQVTEKEARKLFGSIKAILRRAIKNKGTSVDSYVDASGEEGRHQNYLKVYARSGEKCRRCTGQIKRVFMGQRGTYYCPRCQK
jgi:formamidopyrimidine-DNA glycosylase